MLNISPTAGVEDLVSSLVQPEVEDALSRPTEGILGSWEAASKVTVGLRSFSFCSSIPSPKMNSFANPVFLPCWVAPIPSQSSKAKGYIPMTETSNTVNSNKPRLLSLRSWLSQAHVIVKEGVPDAINGFMLCQVSRTSTGVNALSGMWSAGFLHLPYGTLSIAFFRSSLCGLEFLESNLTYLTLSCFLRVCELDMRLFYWGCGLRCKQQNIVKHLIQNSKSDRAKVCFI